MRVTVSLPSCKCPSCRWRCKNHADPLKYQEFRQSLRRPQKKMAILIKLFRCLLNGFLPPALVCTQFNTGCPFSLCPFAPLLLSAWISDGRMLTGRVVEKQTGWGWAYTSVALLSVNGTLHLLQMTTLSIDGTLILPAKNLLCYAKKETICHNIIAKNQT